jgi:hypothetical protein
MCVVATEEPQEQVNPEGVPVEEIPARAEQLGPPALPSQPSAADLLEVNGGFVLFGGGLVLIVLACVFADQATIAPVFAVFGAVLLILATFYSRIEGPVQATKDGVEFTVKATRRLSREQDLPAELEADAVELAVERLAIPSRKPREIERAGETAAKEAVESVTASAFATERRMLEHFAKWLTSEEGFSVARLDVRTPDAGYDLLADKSDEIMVVEAKLGSRSVGPAVVHQLISLPAPADLHDRRIRRALVIPAEKSISTLVLGVAKLQNIELYEVWEDGRVNRVL